MAIVVKLPLTVSVWFYTNVRIFTYLNSKLPWVENVELRWVMGKQKIPGWKSMFQLDKIDSLISIG